MNPSTELYIHIICVSWKHTRIGASLIGSVNRRSCVCWRAAVSVHVLMGRDAVGRCGGFIGHSSVYNIDICIHKLVYWRKDKFTVKYLVIN